MSSKWFAKHFACWSGRERKNHNSTTASGQQQQKKKKRSSSTSEFDEMSITRSIVTKRSLSGQGQHSCAKDGVVKCCDKFCKNHCNLSMIRNDLKGHRSLHAKTTAMVNNNNKSSNVIL